jgi:excisionase family DNA binding protein
MDSVILENKKPATDRASDGLDTIRSLAPRLRRSPRTVQAWMREGKLPYMRVGKSVLFRWEDVLQKLSTYRVN